LANSSKKKVVDAKENQRREEETIDKATNLKSNMFGNLLEFA